MRFAPLRHGRTGGWHRLSGCYGVCRVSRGGDAGNSTSAEYRGGRLCNLAASSKGSRRSENAISADRPFVVHGFCGRIDILDERFYFTLTGLLLIAAATLMAIKRTADTVEAKPIQPIPAAATGAAAGFISGLTGVGGGVFLAPMLIALQWTSPRGAAAVSPPFILCNSIAGFVGVLFAGQSIAPGAFIYAMGAIVGAGIGTVIAQRWMSERTTRYVLATILAFAGARLLLR